MSGRLLETREAVQAMADDEALVCDAGFEIRQVQEVFMHRPWHPTQAATESAQAGSQESGAWLLRAYRAKRIFRTSPSKLAPRVVRPTSVRGRMMLRRACPIWIISSSPAWSMLTSPFSTNGSGKLRM